MRQEWRTARDPLPQTGVEKHHQRGTGRISRSKARVSTKDQRTLQRKAKQGGNTDSEKHVKSWPKAYRRSVVYKTGGGPSCLNSEVHLPL